MRPIEGQGVRPFGAVLWLVLIACMAIVPAGCSTANMRRDLDVSGTLPKLVGLGGFAPTCLAFCFVSNTVTKGDDVQDAAGTEAIEIRSTTEGGVTVKPRGRK